MIGICRIVRFEREKQRIEVYADVKYAELRDGKCEEQAIKD